MTACTCREPRQHRDCMYCGGSWAGEVVCGACREAGVDGRLIPGTGRRTCAAHRTRRGKVKLRRRRAVTGA